MRARFDVAIDKHSTSKGTSTSLSVFRRIWTMQAQILRSLARDNGAGKSLKLVLLDGRGDKAQYKALQHQRTPLIAGGPEAR